MNLNSLNQIFKLKIFGNVQGVGYRAWMKRTITSLNYSGYVFNCDDGSVEVLVECPRHEINLIIKLCYAGPSISDVKEIDCIEEHSIQSSILTGKFYIKD